MTKEARIAALEKRHENLDYEIKGMEVERAPYEDIHLLKRLKLKVKDEIYKLRRNK